MVSNNITATPIFDLCACKHHQAGRKQSRKCRGARMYRSWEVSQSTKVTRVLWTFSDSAVGVGTGGGAWWLEEDPFIISGC